ncbi:TPR domain protein [Penicillium cataractarum]|uniref:TPR domain protein n=1 Tax=Penicillium cataractarum TaxID=2100454 RepID=A0A9X0B5K8_9EURO|nr:TPR domain protein [Penicillium cataractarum]KAJ5388998.1 TPR domain protein [Penicillium cataractarum]
MPLFCYILRVIGTESVAPVERALIEAMHARFPVDHPAEDYDRINHAYDQAMANVYAQFPGDLDVVVLYVDAKMHISQRKMFHALTWFPIETSPVFDIQRLFAKGLQHPYVEKHPGLLHFCVHVWEMSATPVVALPSADYLGGLVPDAGHLHHMPSHIDVLVGDYRRSVASITAAVQADERYLARNGAKNMHSFYRMHNYHSLIYAAMLAGQSNVALENLDSMESSLTEDVLRIESPPLADCLEFFESVRVHIYIQFGQWKETQSTPDSTRQGSVLCHHRNDLLRQEYCPRSNRQCH